MSSADAWVPHTPHALPHSDEYAALYADLPAHHRLPDGSPDYLRMTLGAHLYDLVKQTPLQPATRLSNRLGCEMLLKREDLQPVFSFKLRGAYNMMRQLPDTQKWKGVIACSAGNHAQGVALAGAHLSIPCTIVMPRGTPSIKWENVQRLGAKVVFHGQNFDEAKAECARLAASYGLTIVPPFDHPLVIAGQGTVGVELCSQADFSNVDAVFCAVGGGGLLSGIAAYIKRIAPPHVKVIGVETFDADALARSLTKGERVTLDEVGLFSDGTAVRVVGGECFRVCHEQCDGVVRVSNDEICAAIKDVFEDTRSVTEPAGALAVAGMKRYVAMTGAAGSGKRFIAVVSGANMNFSRLRFVAERAEYGEQKEALLSIEIPDVPGSFMKLYQHIMPRDVTEFSYRYSGAKTALIFASVMLNGTIPTRKNPVVASAEPAPPVQSLRDLELEGIIEGLRSDGMPAVDITDDDFVKSHARYLIGGREDVPDERMFRFEFPERPGALRKFLEMIDAGWNLSLFHYRNQGGDVAKVLAGIQVPKHTEAKFDEFLAKLGYAYYEETDNKVYQRYLRPERADNT
ncbi:threonine ammonia-lyase [Malassezia furfur]|uniref:Threonine dehydratase n=1 Tax=Malassezia furfur TaxID=55194 RepID=A0ABY8EQH7_MALFU|nr:ILV1 [Malassezia furfur]WFD47147.1 threonine ammonia-lyase [Malassezia furfur]